MLPAPFKNPSLISLPPCLALTHGPPNKVSLRAPEVLCWSHSSAGPVLLRPLLFLSPGPHWTSGSVKLFLSAPRPPYMLSLCVAYLAPSFDGLTASHASYVIISPS